MKFGRVEIASVILLGVANPSPTWESETRFWKTAGNNPSAASQAGTTRPDWQAYAEGVMEEIAPGKQALTKVVLHPQIEWIGEAPQETKLDHLRHEAHEVCFITNSAKTKVTVA
jgi:hypothetical protein